MQRNTRRTVHTMAALPLLAVLLTGCGGNSNSGSDSSSVGSSHSAGKSSSDSKASQPSGSSSAKSSASHAPDASVATVQTAQVPANCDMPSVRLSGGQTPTSLRPAQGGPGAFNNAAASPLLLDMTGSGAKQVLWSYGCTAGGVSWPETLVLSDGKGNLVGSVNLGDIAKSEHAEVTKWSVSGKNVVVDWKQYEGAGFDMKDHHSTLSWKSGKLQLTESDSGTTSNANVPEGAAPGAGGPRPANATPLTESTHGEYASELAFKTPSGTNGCQINSGWVRCGTKSGKEMFLTSSGTIPSEPPADDAPMWPEGDALAYGQVRYNGDTVFASTSNGVTVWNTKTGHGALINASGVHQF